MTSNSVMSKDVKYSICYFIDKKLVSLAKDY